MPSSYSQDLRKKVISYIMKGNSSNSAAKKFEIASNTARNWYKRYKLEGNYLPRKVGGRKARVTRDAVLSYIKSNPNFTLLEMGRHFKMTAVGAYYWLKKLGYSYKKKPSPIWKQIKTSVKNIKDK